MRILMYVKPVEKGGKVGKSTSSVSVNGEEVLL